MKNISAYMSLFISFYYVSRGNAVYSRKHLDKALGRLKYEIDFLPAYNSRILMMEGRHREAKDSLRLISKMYFGTLDADRKYILMYSQFFLAIYKKDGLARAIKEEALALNASAVVKRFLPFFSNAAISRILN